MASPTTRTMDLYREYGYEVAKLEYYLTIPGRKFGVRRDAFGFIDIMAINDSETFAIQATSTANMGARVKKILSLPAAKRWCQIGCRRIMVIGWKKYAKPVDRRWWRPTIREILLEDFNEQT